jgi:hypothetical protein
MAAVPLCRSLIVCQDVLDCNQVRDLPTPARLKCCTPAVPHACSAARLQCTCIACRKQATHLLLAGCQVFVIHHTDCGGHAALYHPASLLEHAKAKAKEVLGVGQGGASSHAR